MMKQLLQMPETDEAAERLDVQCPNCKYTLVGLKRQRCPECGEVHGSVQLWQCFLAKTPAGQFINDRRNQWMRDRSLKPSDRTSTTARYQWRDLKTPTWLLAICAVTVSSTIAVNTLISNPVARDSWAIVLTLVSIGTGVVGGVLLTHRRTAIVDQNFVVIRDQFASFGINRAAPRTDAMVLSYERNRSHLGKRRYSCVIFTHSTAFVLWSGSDLDQLNRYLADLPEPVEDLHISFIDDDQLT